MISYSSWNGVKMHGNQYLITDRAQGRAGLHRLRGLGLERHRPDRRRRPASPPPRSRTAVNAGIDMVMVPNDWQTFISLLRDRGAGRPGADGPHRRRQPAHPDQEVRARPVRAPADRPLVHRPPSAAPRTGRWPARRSRESQVLLKNAGNVLPLAKADSKIFVAGKSADNIGNQSGGWTISLAGRAAATITAGHHDPAGHPATPSAAVHHGHLQRRRHRHRQLATGPRSRWSARRRTPRAQGDRPGAHGPGHRPTWPPSPRCAAPACRWSWCWSPAGRWTSPPSCPTGTRWSPPGCRAPRAQGVADVLFGDVRAHRQAADDLDGRAPASSRSTTATARPRCSRTASG